MKARPVLIGIAVLPLLLAAALAGLWIWSGTDQSLQRTLGWASRWLPEGQSLQAQEVSGSLRQGGRIGMLRWHSQGLVVEARELEWAWQPAALLERRLTLQRLHIRQLGIEDSRPPSQPSAPESLMLPLQIELPFTVDTLQWQGPPALQIQGLAGRYQFDGQRHALTIESVQLAAGRYRAQARLLARAPLTLDAQLQGELQTQLPGSPQPLELGAQASIDGSLAGPDAQLEVQAQLRPMAAALQAGQAMQAHLSARISPWAAQPVVQADASFSQFDLAAFWPQAPQTLLTGTVQVQPRAAGPQAAAGWQAQARLSNRLSGPWDRQRLPLDSVQAQIGFAQGQWSIESLQAELAGGRVLVQGQLAGAGWQGRAELQRINPAALHSQLAAAAVDGRLDARAVQQAIEFEARLQPSANQPRASALKGLRLQHAHAQGRWAAGTLSLQALQLQTDEAQLQGQLEVQPAANAARGQLRLTLPGARADVEGSLGAREGGGDFSLRVADAAQAWRWLARLPGAPSTLAQTALQGSGELTGRWQGGWQAAQQGQALALQGRLSVPRLDIVASGRPAQQVLRLRELRAEVNGPLTALALQAQTQLESGSRRFSLETRAGAGRSAGGDWQARIGSLELQAQDSLHPGTWTLQLRQAFSVDWKTRAGGHLLETTAGEATLSGPAAGTATLAWQPMRWSRQGPRTEFSSQGRLQGLPQAWLELLGDAQLAKLGLSGDLVLDADWDLLLADSLRLRATLARRSGDLTVQADGEASRISAGVKEARLSLTGDGDSLRAALRWNSERAGQAQAEFSTRLSRGSGGWDWPAEAPLAGSLRAQLPRLGLWSMLAPPGWRLSGTLDASATLAGTRRAPQWSGSLQADELALRSVVDGIEFSQGRLRTRLAGQRLEIDEFSLQGAGSEGGRLSAQGHALWQPENAGLAGIRMALQAQAQALRVTTRADRRLVVSGQLQANLDQAQLQLRGALKADQALFILPDETAPSLGSDVVVKPSASRPSPAPASAGQRVAPDLAVTLDLGPDFRVQGRGLSSRLAGNLSLRSAAGGAPRLSGEVRTERGSYKAYGQQLDIEEGLLRFTGPYDNPALDILAIRPKLSVRVGVQISGTALAPRVRLYSEPELPDAEKLSWLLLGRSAASGGAEAAVLQQAALALLGGSGKGLSGGLAEALGLDELSLRGPSSTAAGSTSAAAVTLGKRVSRNFYVAYERSLAGTLGTVSIFYDLSRRFTLRAQTGQQNALDLIFTVPYD